MENPIGSFALFCSGANRQILDRQECETERAKFKMIGGFIFLTAVFAGLSGGYALYTGFKSEWLAAAVGMLWALFVFNLDRYIISTLRKKDVDPDLPFLNRVFIKSGEILSALPRIIFAVFISIVISAPLEVKYFDPEIQAQIAQTNFNAAIVIEKKVDEEFHQIEKLQQEIEKLEQSASAKEDECNLLRDVSFSEAEGTAGTGKKGRGPVFREKQEEFEQCKKDLAALKNDAKAQTDAKREDLRQRKSLRDSKADQLKKQKEMGNGFLARLTALHELSSGPGPVGLATLFISILFILMETTPIITKLISKRGPYDDLLEAGEYKVHLNHLKTISDLNEQLNTDLAFNSWKNNLMLSAEQQLIQDTMSNVENVAKDLTEAAQAEVVRDFIFAWKDKSIARCPFLPTAQTQASGD